MDRAERLASQAHRGQVDKAGRPYIEAHVTDVVRRLGADASSDAVAVAWLHDVLEDTEVSEEELRSHFSPEVVDAVVAITHMRNEPRADYYARVKVDPLARQVKLADIASNTDPERMALLDDESRIRLTEKYRKALAALG